MRYLGVILLLAACGGGDGTRRCDEGTVLVGDECLVISVDLSGAFSFNDGDLAVSQYDLGSDLSDPIVSAAQCSGSGNVVYYDGGGSDYIFSGIEKITQGTWSQQSSGGAMPTYVHISVTPTQQSQGLWWDLEFSTQQLGTPLTTMTYTDAERAPFADPGHPGLEISGDGRGCNTLNGSFTVYDLTMTGTDVSSFTASFVQHCEGESIPLQGCVHYEQ